MLSLLALHGIDRGWGLELGGGLASGQLFADQLGSLGCVGGQMGPSCSLC